MQRLNEKKTVAYLILNMSKRTDTCIEADGKWQGGGGAGRLTG